MCSEVLNVLDGKKKKKRTSMTFKNPMNSGLQGLLFFA